MNREIRLSHSFRKPLFGAENYPPAKPDDEILAALKLTQKTAIGFKHVFPPVYREDATTFFGGLPFAPRNFAWPRREEPLSRHKLAGVPHSFLGQINCATLPDCALRRLLPAQGVLYFFVDWGKLGGFEREGDAANLVHYEPGPVCDWHRAEPPRDLPPCYDTDAGYYFDWLRFTTSDLRPYPSTFNKWVMESRVVTSFSQEHPFESDGNSAGRYQELWEQEQLSALKEAFGEPVDGTPLAELHTIRAGNLKEHVPFFPVAWIAIEMVAGKICSDQRQSIWGMELIKKKENPPKPDSEETKVKRKFHEAVSEQAMVWVEKARSAGLFQVVDKSEREAFFAWCDGLKALAHTDSERRRLDAYELKRVVTNASVRSIEECIAHSPGSAALVPHHALQIVVGRHSPLVFGHRNPAGRHQMLGEGRNVQGAPERFRQSHVLLMQFDTDYGLNWMWGDCGALQFWITPGDLSNGRFDKVQVTAEGH